MRAYHWSGPGGLASTSCSAQLERSRSSGWINSKQFRPRSSCGSYPKTRIVDALPYSISPFVSIREMASGLFSMRDRKPWNDVATIHLRIPDLRKKVTQQLTDRAIAIPTIGRKSSSVAKYRASHVETGSDFTACAAWPLGVT